MQKVVHVLSGPRLIVHVNADNDAVNVDKSGQHVSPWETHVTVNENSHSFDTACVLYNAQRLCHILVDVNQQKVFGSEPS